jgi:hypothetical protein
LFIARDQPGFEFGSLRQGDILEGVPFPQLDLQTLELFGNINPDTDYNSRPSINAVTKELRNDAEWLNAALPIRFGFSIVLSNCCDLVARNGRIPAPVFTLARLHQIPGTFRSNADSFNSLRANKDPRDHNDPGYIDYFYLEPHERLNGVDWRVHFNQVSTLPTAPLPLLLRKKILQLDDRTRVKFKIKLGHTYFRFNAEEETAGLENPWQELPQN